MFIPPADFAFENSRFFRAMVTLPHQYLLEALRENIESKRKYGGRGEDRWLLTPFRVFLYSYLLLFFFRLLFMSFCLLEEHHGWSSFWIVLERVDPVMRIIAGDFSSNAMLGFCLAPMVFFELALEVLLHAKPALHFWKVFYELTVENERHFWAYNPRIHYLSIYLNPLNPFETLSQVKAYARRLWHYRRPIFASRLPHFRHVHPLVRFRILLISFVYRQVLKVVLFCQTTFLFIAWLGLLYLIFKYYRRSSRLYLLLGGLDAGLLLYSFKRSFAQLNFFLLHCVLMMTIFTMHLKGLNRLLKNCSLANKVEVEGNFQRMRGGGGGGGVSERFQRRRFSISPTNTVEALQLFKFYRSEQLNIAMAIYHLNEAFVSLLTFLGIGSNVIANIYLVTSLVFDGPTMGVHYQLIMVGGILAQFGGIYQAALPLIVISNTLYSGARHLFVVQRHLHWQFLGEKIALSHYYELLNTDEPVVFKLGYIGTFANDWLFQVN